jgi:hypothetical protein
MPVVNCFTMSKVGAVQFDIAVRLAMQIQALAYEGD